MKLRTKTLLVICAVCSIFFIVMTSLLHIIVMGSYTTLEEKMISDHVTRAVNQFKQELEFIKQLCYDWSTWDDTYYFAEDKNEEYIQANLQYESFADININFILFYNQSGGLLYSKAFDFIQEKEISLPNNFYSLINEKNEILLNKSNYSNYNDGILLYDQTKEPLILCATPIVKSNKDGPIHGTLIMGRFLTEERIEYFQNITQLSITISPLSNNTDMFSSDNNPFTSEKRISIQPVNDTYIIGYTLIDDIFDNPVLLLQVGSDRDIYNQGLSVLQNLFVFLFIITFFLVLSTIFILDKFVTSRLTVFSKSVGEIQDYKDLSKHFDISGNDEVSVLGKNINIMLKSLQNLWSMKDSAETSLQKKVEELERFKTITIDREIKMIELKKQLNELKGKSGEKI